MPAPLGAEPSPPLALCRPARESLKANPIPEKLLAIRSGPIRHESDISKAGEKKKHFRFKYVKESLQR